MGISLLIWKLFTLQMTAGFSNLHCEEMCIKKTLELIFTNEAETNLPSTARNYSLHFGTCTSAHLSFRLN